MIYMADPVLSPDGKFMRTGEEWIPAPPEQTQSSPDAHFNASESPRPESYNPYLPREDSDSSGEDFAIQQSGEALGLATTVVAWNGVVLLAVAFTAYSAMDSMPEWIEGNDYLVLKALVAVWVIGIILSVYSRVKSAPVQDVATQKKIRILNKTSTVLLALPLLPIALFLLLIYFSMKYGNTATRHH